MQSLIISPGLWETALGEDELLTEVRIPTDSANANSCYLKFPQPASRYPFVGCAVAMDSSAGNCSDVRIGFSGVGETAFRDSGVEDALRGNTLNESSIAAASAKAADARSVLSDVFVSEEYRRAMAQVYAQTCTDSTFLKLFFTAILIPVCFIRRQGFPRFSIFSHNLIMHFTIKLINKSIDHD